MLSTFLEIHTGAPLKGGSRMQTTFLLAFVSVDVISPRMLVLFPRVGSFKERSYERSRIRRRAKLKLEYTYYIYITDKCLCLS